MIAGRSGRRRSNPDPHRAKHVSLAAAARNLDRARRAAVASDPGSPEHTEASREIEVWTNALTIADQALNKALRGG